MAPLGVSTLTGRVLMVSPPSHVTNRSRKDLATWPIAWVAMAFHDLTMTSITGDPVDFKQYAGQWNLVVNVASR